MGLNKVVVLKYLIVEILLPSFVFTLYNDITRTKIWVRLKEPCNSQFPFPRRLSTAEANQITSLYGAVISLLKLYVCEWSCAAAVCVVLLNPVSLTVRQSYSLPVFSPWCLLRSPGCLRPLSLSQLVTFVRVHVHLYLFFPLDKWLRGLVKFLSDINFIY